ncbi:uncharacterized protein LOC143046769 [Mytilus galloprovincialis]|uniref:uncharacterized protein LOC143046769 n=1 Tax=Mytilus galloprovincialis TaxID=29158 RepID=UPI003F7B5E89
MGVDEPCRDQEKEIGNKLYRFCENTQLNGDCVYNLSRFLPAEIAMKPPAKYISIVYSCKMKDSTTRSTLSSFETTSSTQSNSISTGSTQNISIKASSILMNSLAASTTLNIYFSLSTSTSDYANEKNAKVTSKSNIGIIIGSVVGSMIFLCIVIIGVCIGRRFVLCNKSHGKLRNNPETNDYVGNQTITLPNIVDRYDYTRNFETNNSQTLDHKTSTPTYIVLHDDTFKPSPESYDDEYAVVDPTAESSFNESPKESTKCSENCMILDPNQIGVDRSKFAKTNQAYEFAKPIHNTNGHQGGLYALSPEDTYDHSGTTRHHKDQDTIYTHAVDNVYDSASRGVNIARTEDTYDHFFGKETEDEYNISRH